MLFFIYLCFHINPKDYCMKLTYIFTIILMLSFFYFFASCVKEDAPDNGEDVINHVKESDPLPEFTVDDGAGNKFTNKDFIGKKSYLVFFTTTCGDCRRELPRIEQVWRKIRDDENCQIITIARKQGKEVVDKFWADQNFTMPKYIDPDRSVYDLFANSMVPRIYLIDRAGIVRWMEIEDFTSISEEELVEKLVSLP